MRWGLGAAVWAACYSPLLIPPTPTVVATNDGNAANQTSLDYPISIPPNDGLILLVAVQLGDSDCVTLEPRTGTVTYGSAVLEELAIVQGTSPTCSSATSVSELWQLVDPSPGSDVNVTVTLGSSPVGAGSENSFQSGAVAVAGASAIAIDAPQLVGSESGGSATSFDVTAPSDPGDLVVSFVGHGAAITGPDAATATLLYRQNVDGATTLNNTAASSAPAPNASSTTMGWIGVFDGWQSIVVAIHPGP